MKSASAAMINLLNTSNTFYMADLYTFTLSNGALLTYTSADFDISWNGHTYSSKGPKFHRGKTRIVTGIEVDTLDVSIFADTTDLVNGVPFLAAIASGAFDGATLQLERAFMPSWGDMTSGTVVLFGGRVADIKMGRTVADLTVKSWLELLNIQMPKNLYQTGCLHALFDSGCALLESNFGTASTVGAGSTTNTINCGLVQSAGYFTLGKISFSSGPNAGLSRSIKAYTPGVLSLAYPLPNAPTVGDAFTVYPGCDKQQSTCQYKFNNLVHYGGMPYIPVPESTL